MKTTNANRAFILAAALMTPVVARGQNPSAAAPADAASGKKSVLGDVWGEVDHIGRDMKSLFVKDDKGKLHEVPLAPNASVTKGAQKQGISVSDIKKGDRVKVSRRDANSQDVHVVVVALPPLERDLKLMANPRRFAVVSRLYAQETRGYNDAERGALDLDQAERLIARLDGILAEEASLAAKNGGSLDRKAYIKLQGELNKAGADRHDEAMGTRVSRR